MSHQLTVDYYNQHAGEFIAGTQDVEMSSMYAPFLRRLPPAARILDAGCGSGRDSRNFIDLGYTVTAFDAAEAMVAAASSLTGLAVLHLTFQELAFAAQFEGIWACASLLHVPQDQMDGVFERLGQALVSGGILYASLKYGSGEQLRSGRWFNDYDEPRLAALLARHPDFSAEEVWVSEDLRLDHAGERWLNFVVSHQAAVSK